MLKVLKQTQIKEAAKILKDGGLIAFPTETVFGFGVVFDNKESYDRLISVKRRPPEQPFTLMLADTKDLKKYMEMNDVSIKLVNKFMPGQFTLIGKAKRGLPAWCVSKEGNVGIRIPDSSMVRDMIRMVGKPLLVPSANKHGEPSMNKSDEVIKVFNEEIDAVIEGESISKIASTIVLLDNNVKLIREGSIKFAEVLEEIKKWN